MPMKRDDAATKLALRLTSFACIGTAALAFLAPASSQAVYTVYFNPEQVREMQAHSVLSVASGVLFLAASLGPHATQKRMLQFSSIGMLGLFFTDAVGAESPELPPAKGAQSGRVAMFELVLAGIMLVSCYGYRKEIEGMEETANEADDDSATKSVLRAFHNVHMMLGVASLVAPDHIRPLMNFGVSSRMGTRLIGASYMLIGLQLVATVRSNYQSQKRALQFLMIPLLVQVGILARELQEKSLGEQLQLNVKASLGVYVVSLAAAIWACYFPKPPSEAQSSSAKPTKSKKAASKAKNSE